MATLYVSSDSTSCTTYNGGSGDTWYRWTVDYSTAVTANVWQVWASDTACSTANCVIDTPIYTQPSAEQEASWAEQSRKDKEARDRAESLLQSLLSEVQRRALEEKRYFELMVEGGEKPARRYRIYRGTAGNIKRLDAEGNEVESWCVHPRGIPEGDVMAGQMLHLLHDDDGLRKAANVTPLRRAA